MKKWRSTWRVISTKQLLYIMLFIESLAVTLAIGIAIASGESPITHFKEKGFITTLSCLQLAVGGVLAWQIYQVLKHSKNSKLAKGKLLWLIISLGLFFLALDETLAIHEQIDTLAHDLLSITETNITDLADDAIVGIYLLIFLACIYWQREVIAFFKPSFIWFLIGFGLTVVMIVLDIASNNDLFTSMFVDNSAQDRIVRLWLAVVEDSAKIFAEGMFIMSIYKCQQIVKSFNI